MGGTRKSPNLLIPVCASGVALLDLGACLMTIAANSQFAEGFIWTELLLIVLAITQWVLYFRAYIDFRIDQALLDKNASATPAPS